MRMKEVFLTVRVAPELRDALNKAAAKRDRTAAAEIRLAIKAHLAKIEKETA